MEYLNRIISILYRHGQRYLSRAIRDNNLPIDVGHIPPLMQIIRHSGITQDGISVNTAMDKGTIARTVAELIKLGLVKREIDADDRRLNHLYATENGLLLKEPLLVIISQYHRQLYKGMSDDEILQANHLLCKILNNLTGSLPDDIPYNVQVKKFT